MPRFVPVDHETPMLLPPDLRAWAPDDHIVHFIMDAIDALSPVIESVEHVLVDSGY
jgi:hypothetical protein